MAASVLTGVNPIHGLYASFAGPIAGGLTASTKLMVITTTSAAALAAGSALEDLTPDERPGALFLLTLIAGAAMIAAGLLRLGRFTRFVSHSVMIGFLSGVAVNIIAGQIPDVTGAASRRIDAPAEGVGRPHPPEPDRPGFAARRSRGLGHHRHPRPNRIAAFSAVVALAVPTVAVIVAGADVAQVEDQGDIPRGVPLPAWPELSAFSVLAAHRGIGGRRDRARAGRRRRRVRAERRRVTIRRQRRLRRPGRGQPQFRVLPGSTRRAVRSARRR